MATKSRAPWQRPNPRKRAGKSSKHLSPAAKSAAKARARRAGRPYPNLVDNMRMAAKKMKKKQATRKTGKKAVKKAASKRVGKKTKSAAAKKSSAAKKSKA